MPPCERGVAHGVADVALTKVLVTVPCLATLRAYQKEARYCAPHNPAKSRADLLSVIVMVAMVTSVGTSISRASVVATVVTVSGIPAVSRIRRISAAERGTAQGSGRNPGCKCCVSPFGGLSGRRTRNCERSDQCT